MSRDPPSRITLELDADLLTKAEKLTGLSDPLILVSAALTALIERESARTLARLGGAEPDLVRAPRRRP